ncbi:MAG: NUDIX pyrophosphatase [Ignavibacterium sp.]|jgi:dATP pyrophosphohydrolase|nr:NUDIX pyrophosphatase [Ignavibacterium sp.]
MNIISNLIEAHIFRIKNGELEFLLLKRSPEQYYPNLWQMVTGKIKENETAYQSALREIKEETGLTPEKFWVAPTVNSFYSPDKDYICILPVFAARVKDECEIKLSKEHTEYKWVNPGEAKQLLAWDGQRKSVDVIVDYVLNRNSFLNFIEIKL